MNRELITAHQRANAEEYLLERAIKAEDFVAEKVHSKRLQKGKNLFRLPDSHSDRGDVLLVVDKGYGGQPQIDRELMHLFHGVSSPDTLMVKQGGIIVPNFVTIPQQGISRELGEGETLWISRRTLFSHYPKTGGVAAALMMQARKR